MPKMILSKTQREELLKTLHARFEKNMNRHKGLEWTKIEAKLNTNPQALWSLHEMERTGGGFIGAGRPGARDGRAAGGPERSYLRAEMT